MSADAINPPAAGAPTATSESGPSSGFRTLSPPPLEAVRDDRVSTVIESLAPGDLGEWADKLTAAKVAAHRRASPDLMAQLFQAIRRPIDTVICNLLDSDPAAA